jgi:hypothetical protein
MRSKQRISVEILAQLVIIKKPKVPIISNNWQFCETPKAGCCHSTKIKGHIYRDRHAELGHLAPQHQRSKSSNGIS